MSIMIYMGSVLATLYYYGITQWLSSVTASFLQALMQTTDVETLGVTSAPLLGDVSNKCAA